MGGHEGWAQPSGFFPNGLLPNEAASVTKVLDPERWSQAEERTAGLIACIQPNQPSEERRQAVASYVQHLITKCFSCKVFTFGSVPLKTYLPDGDIDLTAFSENQNLKDNWANEVRDMLEREEKSENAEFRVKEVQYIQAEVKIIKCLVENIVVDISFNQLGGLCTLCFLEEVNHLISQNHLFKRSIILIKAWCYYESRILGAHHGLISTYALETLVLYIFHVYNNSFAGPLEVLYRFLEFFSKFDWENFCVSLWGPIPICSLPDMTGEPPRKDGGKLLLSKGFLDICSSVYAVLPGGPENQEQPFVSKHFNVIDPLRTNNNLGRSVSKGNFFRIRSAFAFGAQRLARLLDCPKENLIAEVNQFFSNTWDRHGKGHRPDAPSLDHYSVGALNLSQIDGSDTRRNYSNCKKAKENVASYESEVDTAHASQDFSSQHVNHSLKQMSRAGNVPAISRTQDPKAHANVTSSMAPDHNHQNLPSISSNKTSWADMGRNFGPDNIRNELHTMYQFARTHSSPELTDTSTEVLSRGRHNEASEIGKGHTASTRLDYSIRRNYKPDVSEVYSAKFTNENLLPSRQSSSQWSIDAAVDSGNTSNTYYGESGLRYGGKEYPSVADTMQMHQEEQDLVNMMASSAGYSFNGQIHVPVNLASIHPPHLIPPSILTSLGYAHRNSARMVPTNIPSFESSWMHYAQDIVSFPGSQYFPNLGMASYREEVTEAVKSNLVQTEIKSDNNHHGIWLKQSVDCGGGYDHSTASSRACQLEDIQLFTSSSSDSSSLKDHGAIKENWGLVKEKFENISQHQRNRESDVYSTASLRFEAASQASSSRSKLSSESNKDGPALKASKSTRDRRGRKPVPSTDPSILYRFDKNGWEYDSESVDRSSSQADDDNQEWVSLSTIGTEVPGSMVSASVSSSHVQTHQLPGYESAPLVGSNSLHPVAPELLGSGSGQKAKGNTGPLPFAFYPTGPPVPFLTMLPLYNVPTETGTATTSTNHFDRDEDLKSCHKSKLDNCLDLTENLDHSDVFNGSSSMIGAAFVEPPGECKSHILNGDFSSHWQNLQYGRFCQNAQSHGSFLYPSSNAVPPAYLQGQFPWDGPGRPSANMNLLTQLMGYSPRLIPISPLLPGSSRPLSVYQHYAEDIPRYRGGTGTYLPNPKISSRDRQSSNTKNNRGNNSYDRKDHHADREGNWNMNTKSRFVGRGQGRNQSEKPSMRMDRSTPSNSRSNKPFKQDSFPSYHSRNGSYGYSNSTNRSAGNTGYGLYPLPVVNPGGVSASGTALPSIVMLYPYDQNVSYISPADQLEFGSLRPMHFSGLNEASHLGEGSSKGVNEQRNFQGGSTHSSPDLPSSPKHYRKV